MALPYAPRRFDRHVTQIIRQDIGTFRHRNAVWGLAGLSFIESSVFPIPPDVMLIPMALADRARAFSMPLFAHCLGFWRAAGLCDWRVFLGGAGRTDYCTLWRGGV